MKKKNSTSKNILGNSILVNLLAIIICGTAIVLGTLFALNIYTRHGKNIVVPNLSGLQVDEATKIAKSKGLHVVILDSIYQKDAVPGAIFDQTPNAENKVKAGRNIYINVYAQSPQQIAIPNLVDYSERQATALLNSMGFKQLFVEQVPSEHAGVVVSIEYKGVPIKAGDKIPMGAPLKMIVGSGMLSDTSKVNQEYIVAPEDIRLPEENSEAAKVEEESTGIDDTFL